MRRLTLAIGLLLGAAAILPVAAGAGDDPVRVEAVGPDRIETDPGETITARFQIENQSDERREFEPTLDVPEAWSVLSPLQPLALAPGEQRLQLISLSIPSAFPSGEVAVRLQVETAEPPVLTAADELRVDVAVVQEARMDLIRAPRRVRAGDSYEATVSVTNEGNEPVEAIYEASVSPDRDVELSTVEDTLAPGEAARVDATVETGTATRVIEDRLTVAARLEAWDLTLSERATVEVVPVGEGRAFLGDPLYPATVRLQTFGTSAAQGAQVEFDGSGALTEDGTRQLDLFLRAPGQSGVAQFGRRDRYRFTYATPSWVVRGGDHGFSRTRLAERGISGTGAEVRYRSRPEEEGADVEAAREEELGRPGAWTAGGYALQSRFGRATRQAAAYGGYRLHPRARLTANVVHTDGGFDTDGTRGTLRGTLVPWRNAELIMEGGVGRGERDWGAAYRAELQGDLPWARYRARHLEVGTTFPSRRSDTRRTTAGLTLQPTDPFSVSANVQRLERDRAQDESSVTRRARLSTSLQGDLGEAVRAGISARARLTRRPQQERETVQARGQLQVGPVGIRPGIEVGQTRTEDPASTVRFQTYEARASISAGPQRFRGRAQYTEFSADGGDAPSPNFRASLSSQTSLTDRASFRARGRLQGGVGPQPAIGNVQASLDYRLPFDHQLSAEARFRSIGTGNVDPRARLTYAVPVNLPTPDLDPEEEELSGRVFDAQTGDPIPDVRLQMGPAQRLTDLEGRFVLPVPPEGAFLRLDRATIAPDRVPMIQLPREIDPVDAVTELDIPISDAASLVVEVILFEFPTALAAAEGEDPEPVGGISGEIVVIEDDIGSESQLTGAQGDARFDRIRPGRWTVEVGDFQIPEGQTVEQDLYEVDLEPGERDTLTVRALPEERPEIEILDPEDPDPDPELDVEPDDPGLDVDPDEPEPEEPEPEEPEGPSDQPAFARTMGPYIVQMGAFSEWERAVQRLQEAHETEAQVGIMPSRVGEQVVYRVWKGSYRRAAAAEEEAQDVATTFPEAYARPDAALEDYAVQVGAFADLERAIEQGRRLEADGRNVAIQPTQWDGRTVYRVWAGWADGVLEANQRQEEVANLAPETMVIQVEAPDPYTVQVGSFGRIEQALPLVWRMRAADEPASIHYERVGEEEQFMVQVGTYAEYARAAERAEDLAARVPGPVFVRPVIWEERGEDY